MKLREWNWDATAFVEVDYPDAPIAEFVNYFRTTKAWVDDPQRVNRKVLALEQALATHRREATAALVATAVNMTAPSAPALKPAAPRKGGRRAAHAEGTST